MRRARQQGADGVQGGEDEDVPGPGGEGSSEVLLDTDEQAALIAELRRKGQQQNRSTRRLFQALSALLLLALLYCAVMALTWPSFLEHQDVFRVAVSPLGFILSYAAHALCVLVALAVFLNKHDALLLAVGFAAASANLFGWLGVFAHYTPYPSVGYWWLPLAGLGILLVALYVERDLRWLQKDIESLEKLRYNYKKV